MAQKTNFLLKKQEEGVNLLSKHRTEITRITDLKDPCELFLFYLAASSCGCETKLEQRASFVILSKAVQ